MANEKMAILKMLEEGKISATEASRLMEASEKKSANFDLDQKRADMSNAGSFDNSTVNRNMNNPHTNNQSINNDYNKTNQHNNQNNSFNNQGYQNNQNSYNSQNSSTGNSQGNGNQSFNGTNQGFSGQNQNNNYQGSGYNSGSYQGMGFDDFANDLGRKFDTFAKDMEPKIQNFTKTFVEKTANMADSLSKSIQNSTLYKEPYRAPYKPSTANQANAFEKNFELKVENGYCELNLKGLNGDVMINGYNGDKITAKVYYRPKANNAPIDLLRLGDKYFLNYDEDAFDFVTIDAYVPETMFKNIKFDTVNGNVFASTISSEFFTVNVSNGKTELKNIYSTNIKADCGNGELNLFNISGENASLELFNGNVVATSIDIANLNTSTSNGSMNINIDYFRRYKSYTWVLEASNGKFVMNLPSAPDLAYYIKAQTSLNSAKVGLSGMNYIMNNGSLVEATSYNIDSAERIVKIKAETSNAPLSIN